MFQRFKQTIISSAAAALLLATGATGLRAAEFTADMTEDHGGQSRTSKLYVKDGKYRIDQEGGGHQFAVLVDPAIGMTRVLVTDDREYLELESQHPVSLMNDPFQGLIYSESIAETKPAGSEQLEGYECEKYLISMEGQDMMTKWVAVKLGFPIRIVSHGGGGSTLDITNIVEQPVDDSLFETPADYTRQYAPGEEPVETPDWAAGIPEAPVLTPPFEQDMVPGDMIRVKVLPGKSLAFKAKLTGDTVCVARAIPFKDGAPLKNISYYNNFASKGTICTRSHETTPIADEVVVRAFEGSFLLLGKYMEMTEKTVNAGEELRFPISGYDNLEARFVNMSEGESVCVFNYFRDGVQMPEEEVGKERYRTIRLEKQFEEKKNAYSPNGDEVVFRVDEGSMLVKVGQFDGFEF